ncbi:DoxX family protein [Spongiivirga sp. MCCC 1A20706]|uniref:DoxX family protein n=1 Tax=Spongiivirga sp. MCCC 1A20706 TaxID=3160963 RepID=UPI003977AE40
MIFKTLNKLEKFKDYAPVGIRFIFLLYFILAVDHQSFMPSNVEKFAGNLAEMNWPMSTFLAYLASWSGIIAYVFVIIGWKTRLASIPIVIYFLVAVLGFHAAKGHGISESMSATVLLVMGIFLLLNGPGKPSIDEGL